MKTFKVTLTSIAFLILIIAWGMAIWALNLQDYQAPEMVAFLGRFHPLVLHVPIGLMVLALLLDLGHLLPLRFRENIPQTKWLHGLVLLTTLPAVVHGILLFVSGGYEGSELAVRHLKGGCIFLTTSAIIFLFKLWSPSVNYTRIIGAPLTLGSFIVLSISSHDGASLTHGKNYLSQYAPEFLKPILDPGYDKSALKAPEKTFADENVYEVAVQPIFNRICIQCHKESKSKAKLRMDSYEELVKGGESGEAFEPGNVARSYMIERMYLDLDDEERMPPEGKPQHTADELAILEWWIEIGAPAEGSLKSYNPPSRLLPVIESFGEIH